MSEGPLEALLDKLRQLFQHEYGRGGHDALNRIIDVIKGEPKRVSGRTAKRGGKKRAARGSAKAFIERVLREQKTASVPAILAAAKSPAERNVSVSAIRFELYRGKKDRRYRNTKGQWSLPTSKPSK